MFNIRLIVEYDGAGFHGWQAQPNVRTIEVTLKEVLTTVLRMPITKVNGSGRTDAGVHARHQVVTFTSDREIDLRHLQLAVSSLMKGELSVLSAEYVPLDFHPRFSVKEKEYHYRILNRSTPPTIDKNRCWHVGATLNLDKMKDGARALIGTHDFASFMSAGSQVQDTVRTIYKSELIQEGQFIIYQVVGSGFLKQMVRNIVGSLVEIGRRAEALSIIDILAAKDRRKAGVAAPPCGLYLMNVKY